MIGDKKLQQCDTVQKTEWYSSSLTYLSLVHSHLVEQAQEVGALLFATLSTQLRLVLRFANHLQKYE